MSPSSVCIVRQPPSVANSSRCPAFLCPCFVSISPCLSLTMSIWLPADCYMFHLFCNTSCALAATICPTPVTFWPWKWCPSHVWRGHFCRPRPLCSRLRPDVRDRQTDVRQHCLMQPRGRGHNNDAKVSIFFYSTQVIQVFAQPGHLMFSVLHKYLFMKTWSLLIIISIILLVSDAASVLSLHWSLHFGPSQTS